MRCVCFHLSLVERPGLSAHNTIKRQKHTHTLTSRPHAQRRFAAAWNMLMFLLFWIVNTHRVILQSLFSVRCSHCFGQVFVVVVAVALSHWWTSLNSKTKIKNELNDKLRNIPCNYSLFIIQPISWACDSRSFSIYIAAMSVCVYCA